MKRQTWPMLAQLSRFLPVFQDMSRVVQTNTTQNRLSREPFPFLACARMNQPCPVSNVDLERQRRTTHPRSRDQAGCRLPGARSAGAQQRCFERGRYHKGIHCTCGHQFIMRLGLNDVGLVVVFVCICIIIHSIIPTFIGLGTV